VTDEAGIRDMHQLHRQGAVVQQSARRRRRGDGRAPWQNRDARGGLCHHQTQDALRIALGRKRRRRPTRARSPPTKTSAFGSVIAFNTVVDRSTALAMRDLFVEVVVAPRVDADALAVFRKRKTCAS